MFGPSFVEQCLVSVLVLQSSWFRESYLLMSFDYWCSVTLPHSAIG